MAIEQRQVEKFALRRVPRRRGMISGFIIVVLGLWGALIPFIGPYFNYGYSPLTTWTWTAARGWLEVLPGAVAVLGGFMLLAGVSRASLTFGAWLAAAAGAWFVVGPSVALSLNLDLGTPQNSHEGVRVVASLGLFYALGVVIVFLAATALGRLSVRSLGDLRAAERNLTSATSAVEQVPADETSIDRTPVEAAPLDAAPTEQLPVVDPDTTVRPRTDEPIPTAGSTTQSTRHHGHAFGRVRERR